MQFIIIYYANNSRQETTVTYMFPGDLHSSSNIKLITDN